MSFRLLVSFLVGAALFIILPIYAPFVVLQTEEMPRFLLGLGAGVVAGAVLTLERRSYSQGLNANCLDYTAPGLNAIGGDPAAVDANTR